ncbi:hypothetical protein U1Q18_042307 [Sarracenia purpurea var. burkii]
MVRLGCDPRVCLSPIFPGPRDLRASVTRPSGSPSTRCSEPLVHRRPRLWVRRASLVRRRRWTGVLPLCLPPSSSGSPPTLNWGFRRVSVRLRHLGWIKLFRDLGLLGTPWVSKLLPVRKRQSCVCPDLLGWGRKLVTEGIHLPCSL